MRGWWCVGELRAEEGRLRHMFSHGFCIRRQLFKALKHTQYFFTSRWRLLNAVISTPVRNKSVKLQCSILSMNFASLVDHKFSLMWCEKRNIFWVKSVCLLAESCWADPVGIWELTRGAGGAEYYSSAKIFWGLHARFSSSSKVKYSCELFALDVVREV